MASYCHGFAQQANGWYNTDSLLTRLSANKKNAKILNEASAIYRRAGLDSAHLSLPAFKVAYLEKKWIDDRQIRLKGLKQYKKKQQLTIVDYTRPGNMPRMVTINTSRRKIVQESLVTQGAGTTAQKNDKYCLPVFFSNEPGSECSSLGMILATKGAQPDNPCHRCRFALTQKHDCVVLEEGLEKGINENILARDVVVHTTGSLSYGTGSLRRRLKITDTLYRIVPDSCLCITARADGTPKRTGAYASQCGIAENGGYMGQSNGCLVLPEETHIGMMNTIKGGSLIFIYSNAITDNTNYFTDSPILKAIAKLSSASSIKHHRKGK